MKRWDYGSYNERYLLRKGDSISGDFGYIKVADIIDDPLTEFKSFGAQMTYIDPPWNTENINSFYTKADSKVHRSFDLFIKSLLARVQSLSTAVNYMEMGQAHAGTVFGLLQGLSARVFGLFDITYYHRHPATLIKYTFDPDYVYKPIDFNGMDDDDTPGKAIKGEGLGSCADLCLGQGLTARVCHKLGVKFYGVELNPKRMAVLLEYYRLNNVPFTIKRG